MAKKIYKYQLDITDEQRVMMPLGACVLSVQEQQGRLCMWVMVNPEQPLVESIIEIYGTGHDVNNDGSMMYHATVVMGDLVWHVFERV